MDGEQEEVRSNIWNEPHEEPPHHPYIELESIISFDGFDRDNYPEDEVKVLQPRIEVLGYHKITWMDYDKNYLAWSEARVCKAVGQDGAIVWFVYG